MKRKIWHRLTTAVLTAAIGSTMSIVGSVEATLASPLTDLVATDRLITDPQDNTTTDNPSTTVDTRNNFAPSPSEIDSRPKDLENPNGQLNKPAITEQNKPVQPANNIVPVTKPQPKKAVETRSISNNNAAPAKKPQPKKINQTSATPRPAAQISSRPSTTGSLKRKVKTRKQGMASWYGPGFHGRPTASGEKFNPHGMTAAHRTLPIGTKVRVTNLKNGRSVVVRINDRGPFGGGRIIDLSQGAARLIGVFHSGVAPVLLEVLGR